MEKTKPDTTKACIHQSKKISKEKCRKKDKWGSMQYKQTIYIHSFNGPLSGTTQVSRYQKGKTNLDFTEARDSEWQ